MTRAYISPKISQVDFITGALHLQYILSANISFIGVILLENQFLDHPDTLSLGLIYILKQNLIQTNLPISRRITWIIIIALFQTFKVRDLLTSIYYPSFNKENTSENMDFRPRRVSMILHVAFMLHVKFLEVQSQDAF